MTAAYDAVVIGAGAAGMMAAGVAAQRGLRVALVDHATHLAEKIRISGGGRCNFTNIGTTPANFLSRNPDFCRSALRAYTPRDFIELIESHGVRWHEKHRGQLFCDDSSESIIEVLRRECDAGGVHWRMPCAVQAVTIEDGVYVLDTAQGRLRARQLVLATGGMAIPQMGATDFSLRVARGFGLRIVEPRPALVPLVFDAEQWRPFAALAGVALEVGMRAVPTGTDPAAGAPGPGAGRHHRRHAAPDFVEDLLFTHRGLSGPAVLQISSHWRPGEAIVVDLSPHEPMADYLLRQKAGGRQLLSTVLAQAWPRRLAESWLAQSGGLDALRVADASDRDLRALAGRIHDWRLWPTGTSGYKKAEAMSGGVDTDELDQRSMQARRRPGLYIVGEAVDVTGWLGGYNFQWAWASGMACGRALLPA
ncbi:aminoacetone oxidase family FAD-binding enzyme [Castellaniella sp. GW247-6E4]|uniref:NAD(P)/FAD-dependent oxidoreductase n=1 Tax=Castellaniella sp. GW247-6E4 TaxID=3140380 RepID=UPI0033153FD4